MPYGRPQFGGQPLLQRAVGSAWASSNGGGPFADGFASDFQPFAPNDVFTFKLVSQPTLVDASGTASFVSALEDVNGVAAQNIVMQGPPIDPSTGLDFLFFVSGMITCLAATNTVRFILSAGFVIGPPSQNPPQAQANMLPSAGQYVLDGAVWRLRITGATGTLEGQTDGFVSEGRV